MNGDSAAQAPSQVKRPKLAIKDQNTKRATGEKFIPLKIRDVEEIVNRNSTSTAAKRAITPPNLLGIERKIAYANR